jgi:hypothetical protein
LPDLALNLSLSLGGHVELPDDEVFHKPAGRLRREQTLRPMAHRYVAHSIRGCARLRYRTCLP